MSKKNRSNAKNVQKAHEMQAPRFDENGNLIQGAAMVDNNAVVEPQTAMVDVPDNTPQIEVKTVSGNKYIALLREEKRGNIVSDNITIVCNCNQRALTIAMLYLCAELYNEPYGKGQGKALASRILTRCFGFSNAKQDILAREISPTGLPRYMAWALGDTKDAPRHRRGGDLFDAKGRAGELLASGECKRWFDRYATSEGYVANK